MTSATASELEVPPKDPPDWRDWINEFPTIKGIAFICIMAWVFTPIVIAVAGVWGYARALEPTPGILHVLDSWLNTLNWFTPFAIGGVVGKRLSEKPEVIRAEGEVKAAVIAAKANAPVPAADAPAGEWVDADADPTKRPK